MTNPTEPKRTLPSAGGTAAKPASGAPLKATRKRFASQARPAPKGKATPNPKVAPNAKVSAKAAHTLPVQAPQPVKKAAKPSKPAKVGKPPKVRSKPVRDGFTMPEADFALIATLKARALAAKRETKKSELLRAGLHALAAMESTALLAALEQLEPVKVGRPKKGH